MNPPDHRRILIIDDSRAIHDDFAKILGPRASRAKSAAVEHALFGTASEAPPPAAPFDLNSAFQGEESLEMVRRASAEGRPYAVAFMDVRMPPGWDGIETTSRLWAVDPDLQVVICTAYSDYSWSDVIGKLGESDRFVILKKPFDNVEARQLALVLTEKWRLARESTQRSGR